MTWWQYILCGLAVYFSVGLTIFAVLRSWMLWDKYVRKIYEPKESLGVAIAWLSIPFWPAWIYIFVRNWVQDLRERFTW
jgi:hypothetical protein